jgi:hypothetical protein
VIKGGGETGTSRVEVRNNSRERRHEDVYLGLSRYTKHKQAGSHTAEMSSANECIRDRPGPALHRDLQYSIVHPPLFQHFNSPTFQMKCSISYLQGVLVVMWLHEIKAQVAKPK